MVAAAVVLAVGAAVYGLPAPDDPLAVAGWFLAGLACFVAIGVALGRCCRAAGRPTPSATCSSSPCSSSAAAARPATS